MTFHVAIEVVEDHPQTGHTFVEVRSLDLHGKKAAMVLPPPFPAAPERIRDAASLCFLAVIKELMP